MIVLNVSHLLDVKMDTVLKDLNVVARKDGQELFVMNVIIYNVKLSMK